MFSLEPNNSLPVPTREVTEKADQRPSLQYMVEEGEATETRKVQTDDTKRNFFTVRTIRLSTKIMQPLFLEIFKTRLGKALSNLVIS